MRFGNAAVAEAECPRRENSTCRVQCDDGWLPIATVIMKTTCRADGTWNKESSSYCELKTTPTTTSSTSTTTTTTTTTTPTTTTPTTTRPKTTTKPKVDQTTITTTTPSTTKLPVAFCPNLPLSKHAVWDGVCSNQVTN